jgi:O-succinylbenzoic acid--CoA ligase
MNDPLSVLAAAREAPRAPAITDGDTTLSFGELAERVRSRVEELPEGLDPRRPLPLSGELSIATVITILALLECRVPALLMHPRLTPHEQEGLLRAAATSGPLPGRDPAAVVHTSGTTGSPRAAVLSRAALVASARASESNLGWRDNDRWLLCMPLAHVGGLSILTRCLVARKCVALWPRFDAAAFPDWVDANAVTLASLVPAMLDRVLHAHPRWSPPARLRTILIGGAGATPGLLAQAAGRSIPLVLSYGLTETCAQIAATRYASRASPAAEHSGFALPGVELRVRDGRIEVRGATMMSGYWSEPPLRAGDWFDTGDVGELDANGALVVHARRVDLVVTGGENVYPAEVEAVLEACPGVAAAGVFGVPDDVWGQTVAAAIVPSGTPPDDALLGKWIGERLAPHKRPRAICHVPQLPLTRGGKLDRQRLAEFGSRLRPL